QWRVGLEVQKRNCSFAEKTNPIFGNAEIPQHVAFRQQITAVRLTGKILVDLHLAHEVEVDALAHQQTQLLNGIIAVQRDPHRPAEKQVIGIAGTEGQPDKLLSVHHDRVLYKIHIERRRHIGYRAQEKIGKNGDIVVIDIEVLVKTIEIHA